MNDQLRIADYLEDGEIFDESDDSDVLPGGLLADLDAQQNEVLRRLDLLNAEIERLVKEWSPRQPEAGAPQEAA